MAEIELVIVNALDLYPFYDKLSKMVEKMDDLCAETRKKGGSLRLVKIPGVRLIKIFNDSYERMRSLCRADGDSEELFPQMCNGRSFKKNQELILTALLIYKQIFVSITEVANVMDLF